MTSSIRNTTASKLASFTSNRRGFLAAGGALAATAALAGCGTQGRTTNTPSGNGQTSQGLPAFEQGKAPAPTLPGDGAIIEPAYTSYPKELTTTVPEVPGKGGTYRGACVAFGPPPGNDTGYAKFLNEKLGATIEYIGIPSADYRAKVQAMMASGRDLPDFVVITGWNIPPKMMDAFKGQFQDLTPLLGGDSVKQYPNLAAIPSAVWRGAFWEGQVVALPVPGPLSGFVNFKRQDLWEAAGVVDPKNFAEYKAALTKLNAPDQGRYATGDMNGTLTRAAGLPVSWAEVNGEITHPWLSDAFTDVLAKQRELWAANLVHPDIVTGTGDPRKLFDAGKITTCDNGHDAWRGFKGPAPDSGRPENYRVNGVAPFSLDGTTPPVMFSELPAVFLTFVNKKLSPDQTKELLGVFNYFAAPFGSVEYQNVIFGKEGEHHTVSETGPTQTAAGSKEIIFPPNTVAGPRVTYDGKFKQWVEDVHAYQSAITPIAKFPKTLGLYVDLPSDVATASQEGTDLIADIVRGRAEVSAWEPAIKKWRDGPAQKAKQAYEKALADND